MMTWNAHSFALLGRTQLAVRLAASAVLRVD